jgi:hypothetical protein
VQGIIPPVEGGLDDAMQLTEIEAARYDQATPGRRLDLGDRNPDLERVGFLEKRMPASMPAPATI